MLKPVTSISTPWGSKWHLFKYNKQARKSKWPYVQILIATTLLDTPNLTEYPTCPSGIRLAYLTHFFKIHYSTPINEVATTLEKKYIYTIG
jgi:hypothetical protein